MLRPESLGCIAVQHSMHLIKAILSALGGSLVRCRGGRDERCPNEQSLAAIPADPSPDLRLHRGFVLCVARTTNRHLDFESRFVFPALRPESDVDARERSSAHQRLAADATLYDFRPILSL